jgi:hypothetical protein
MLLGTSCTIVGIDQCSLEPILRNDFLFFHHGHGGGVCLRSGDDRPPSNAADFASVKPAQFVRMLVSAAECFRMGTAVRGGKTIVRKVMSTEVSWRTSMDANLGRHLVFLSLSVVVLAMVYRDYRHAAAFLVFPFCYCQVHELAP